jgi:hypothetical protein
MLFFDASTRGSDAYQRCKGQNNKPTAKSDQNRGMEEFVAHLGATRRQGRLGDKPPDPCSVSSVHGCFEPSLCFEGLDRAERLTPVSF